MWLGAGNMVRNKVTTSGNSSGSSGSLVMSRKMLEEFKSQSSKYRQDSAFDRDYIFVYSVFTSTLCVRCLPAAKWRALGLRQSHLVALRKRYENISIDFVDDFIECTVKVTHWANPRNRKRGAPYNTYCTPGSDTCILTLVFSLNSFPLYLQLRPSFKDLIVSPLKVFPWELRTWGEWGVCESRQEDGNVTCGGG